VDRYLNALREEAMEDLISLDERGGVKGQDLTDSLFPRVGGSLGVDGIDGAAEALDEHDVVEGRPFRGGLARGDVRAVEDLVVQ
jgi:hypothetical protein